MTLYNAAQIKVLIFIATKAYKHNDLFLSKLQIAEDMGVNRETSAKCLKLFCEFGVLQDTLNVTEIGVSIYLFNSFDAGMVNGHVGIQNPSRIGVENGLGWGANLDITYKHSSRNR